MNHTKNTEFIRWFSFYDKRLNIIKIFMRYGNVEYFLWFDFYDSVENPLLLNEAEIFPRTIFFLCPSLSFSVCLSLNSLLAFSFSLPVFFAPTFTLFLLGGLKSPTHCSLNTFCFVLRCRFFDLRLFLLRWKKYELNYRVGI